MSHFTLGAEEKLASICWSYGITGAMDWDVGVSLFAIPQSWDSDQFESEMRRHVKKVGKHWTASFCGNWGDYLTGPHGFPEGVRLLDHPFFTGFVVDAEECLMEKN